MWRVGMVTSNEQRSQTVSVVGSAEEIATAARCYNTGFGEKNKLVMQLKDKEFSTLHAIFVLPEKFFTGVHQLDGLAANALGMIIFQQGSGVAAPPFISSHPPLPSRPGPGAAFRTAGRVSLHGIHARFPHEGMGTLLWRLCREACKGARIYVIHLRSCETEARDFWFKQGVPP